MSAFDRIIGYSAIKEELMQISDTLKNRAAYDRLGVSAPRGLLLHGEPGVGKSLMAGAVIEQSGRKVFTCRKDQPNGDFVKVIKTTFREAAENAPAIVYLDDMDKFSNGDERHPDAEKYVTVQSCIDAAKDKQLFVLATANNIRCLPHSLYRAGRFDRVINVEAPRGRDAVEIISHYIKNKKFVKDADPAVIASIMHNHSCAELETVINQAGLYAGYEQADVITMEHFLKACMKAIYNISDFRISAAEQEDDEPLQCDENSVSAQTIYHESGHVEVSEVLYPESVALATAYGDGQRRNGFVDCGDDDDNDELLQHKEQRHIIVALAGMAAVEKKFGVFDSGCEIDLNRAFSRVELLVGGNCVCGLDLHINDILDDSQTLKSKREMVVSAEMEKYYRKAKEILALNNEFFEKVAAELARKSLLSAADIKKIKSECKIVSVEL